MATKEDKDRFSWKLALVAAGTILLVGFVKFAEQEFGPTPYMVLSIEDGKTHYGCFSFPELNRCRADCKARGDCDCQRMVETTPPRQPE